MMDKKSANGFQTKASEGGIQRKQLPYSVETPYGFHLDLDFLKYVDDIEKGNTIKRVHIQRRVKGPPKFSTLPRNFSLPGHGVRPVPKERDSMWSGTSTLGPKPKSRVTEVQQIFDFRAGEGGTSSQGSRGTTSQGTGYFSPKPREEVSAAAPGAEDKAGGIQSRPNLLRASSMPITLQQRKGSDSSSPDRTLGTPENGSTENMFRPSPDITERRCLPQDRTGLHQQITVALKRVRELEEQVKTIPELKAQICSLREEREQLLLQLQAKAQAQAQVSASETASQDVRTKTTQQGQRPPGGLNLPLVTQPTGGFEVSQPAPARQVTGKEKQGETESTNLTKKRGRSSAPGDAEGSSEQRVERETLPSEKIDRAQDIAGQPSASQRDAQDAAKEGKLKESDSMQNLQEKLIILEAKLTQASQELERTNSLLKEQMEENKLKEERILQLSEGMRVEICTGESHNRSRRESIDAGTVTERVDFSNQETETETPGRVDQGTDTDKICIQVVVPEPAAGSSDQGTAMASVDTHDQVTEVEADMTAGSPPRPRANSMERGTITESIATQDQTTETPVARRVNQVTETEGETVTDHPQRPRASSVDRGTETERVDTVDRVTETEAAQRTDQETETERRQDNNPTRDVGTESHVAENEESRREVVDAVVSERRDDVDTKDGVQRDSEILAVEVCAESSTAAVESLVQTVVSDVSQKDESPSSVVLTGENKIKVSPAEDGSQTEETTPPQSVETEINERKQDVPETTEKEATREEETVKEAVVADVVAVTAESSAVKTLAPVRPQRGRKMSAEQVQPPPPQAQAAPVRPRRGSSEAQAQKTQPKAPPKAPVESEVQVAPQPSAPVESEAQVAPQPSAQVSEPPVKPETPSVTEVEKVKKMSKEKQPPSQIQAEAQGPAPSEVQVRPKSIQAKSQGSSRRDSKEVKAPQKGPGAAQAPRRGSGEGQTRPTRQASSEGSRRSSSETQRPSKDTSETQSLRRGSSEAGQQRGPSEAQAPRRDSGEAPPPRRGSGESPTSPAALGQVVTRLTGLLGEQWAQLGSGSGAQQAAGQQESPSAPKQATAKRPEAAKGAPAKPAGKAAPAAAAGKPAGKPAGKAGPSKMSSIQSQLVSSLSVLSAFYSPGQKAAAAKQQEQGLKSIMKKNGVADKQGSKGAKKNLKFVGVNGGYETTSSEESSGDEKPKVEVEEEDSSEPEVEEEKEKGTGEKEKKEEEKEKEPQQAAAETQGKEAEASAEAGGAVGETKEVERGLMDPEGCQELLEEGAEGEKVDKGFIDACIYVKDRMEEVSSPDKEMRQILVVLYKEWFRVSSQKDSQAETVRLYLRQVGMTTPTLLPYVVNLTDGNGNMALHYSVSHSNFPVVKLLLDTGLCETDNVNKAGYTPVMLAALTAAETPDDLEVAQQLLKLGDVDARSRQAGQTALMLAVSHGRVSMVKLLLSCGADVNAQDREGSTALMCASEHGHTHITRLLLETGRCDTALADKKGQTALSVAQGSSHQEIIDLLTANAKSGAPAPPTDLP